MGEQKLQITLSIDNLNKVLHGLSQLPFFQVSGVITDIQKQAEAQLAPQVQESPEASEA